MQNDPRFPIGKFDRDSRAVRADLILTITKLPSDIVFAVDALSDDQLDTPYREGGWTIRQTVHHVADSHMNAYIRFKLALTEEVPTIRPYYEDRWAELVDSEMPVGPSLEIIGGVHSRWAKLLASMIDAEFEREFEHPDTGRWKLEEMLGLYAWHGRHHVAHITGTREQNGW